MALAPVPITATRLSSRSIPSPGQRAVWADGPAKEPDPGRSGILGLLKAPTALMTTAAVCTVASPSGPRASTSQRWAASSQVAETTSVPKVMWSVTPKSAATFEA